MRRLILPIAGFLTLAAFLAGGVWWWAYGSALERIAARGQSELSLASDRLLGQLQRFRQLAVVLAEHPGLTALLSADSDQFVAGAEALLLEMADKTGSAEIFVLSASGRRVASSRPGAGAADFSDTAYFRRAMHGALGTQLSQADGRAIYYAAPLIRPGRGPIGAVVVKVDIEAVETDWRGDPNILFFTDSLGVVFVANRSELLFTTRAPLAEVRAAAARVYDPSVIRAFPKLGARRRAGFELWQSDGGLFPRNALYLTRPLPVIGLDAGILVDAAPAGRLAALQAGVAAALVLVFGAALLIVIQRRAALSERLALERRAKDALEDQVNRRTAQLSDANRDLRQQIRERLEAEAALRQAQRDLVQAGKLSALGQMSAGISHELNQPLMAIRSFAENATQFLERGDQQTARRNLDRISDLARRMGRIIRNLRMFARKEGEPVSTVDLRAVVAATLELSEKRLESAGVALDWQPPESPVLVRGGEVRLQQVLLNLVSNAADAMEGGAEKRLEIAIETGADTTRLIVRDTGPELAEAERIFDPFYTTKSVGAGEGMGLGLSISYGIVQSFGGRINGRNRPGGGAEFTVELTPAAPGEVAA